MLVCADFDSAFFICMAFMFEKYSMSISDTTFGAGSDIHIQLSQISHSVQTCNEETSKSRVNYGMRIVL